MSKNYYSEELELRGKTMLWEEGEIDEGRNKNYRKIRIKSHDNGKLKRVGGRI